MSDTLRVAFLGPRGTFTHQATFEVLGDNAEYLPQDSIAETFNAVSSSIPLAVLPIENSVFGAVIDTLDLLRLPQAGQQVFVLGEVVTRISHSLIVRAGVKLEELKRIASHEQALGQCAEFIKSTLPWVQVEKSTSTATAACAALSDPSGQLGAIASRICTKVYPGLEILRDNIEDCPNNQTRFIVLSNSSHGVLPLNSQLGLSQNSHAFLRIKMPTLTGNCGRSNLTPLLALLSPLLVSRLDRRPSLDSRPFHDVYFLSVTHELERLDKDEWSSLVDQALGRIRLLLSEGGNDKTVNAETNGRVTLLGIW